MPSTKWIPVGQAVDHLLDAMEWEVANEIPRGASMFFELCLGIMNPDGTITRLENGQNLVVRGEW